MRRSKPASRRNPYLEKTVNLTGGIVGLGVASQASAGLPGLAGTITRGGTLPIASLSLLQEAAPRTRRRRK